MIEAHKRAERQQDDEVVVVARPDSVPRRVLDLAGVALMVDVYDSREAALAAVSTKDLLNLARRRRLSGGDHPRYSVGMSHPSAG